ncbi:hypothetical protein KAH37_04675 [bacterium]|nr:hypothetical protein [bacterium]
MKEKIALLAILLILMTTVLHASLFGEENAALNTIVTQMIFLNKHAATANSISTSQVIPNITKVIGGLTKLYKIAIEAKRIGSKIKDLSKENWKASIKEELSHSYPGMDGKSVEDMLKRGGEKMVGMMDDKYRSYFMRWGKKALSVKRKLVGKYQKYSLKGNLSGVTLAKMAVYEAWEKAGLGQELLAESKYRKRFHDMYTAYKTQALDNGNLGQKIMSAVLQSTNMGTEELNALRKHADMDTLEKQFSKERLLEYMKGATKDAASKADDLPFATPE